MTTFVLIYLLVLLSAYIFLSVILGRNIKWRIREPVFLLLALILVRSSSPGSVRYSVANRAVSLYSERWLFNSMQVHRDMCMAAYDYHEPTYLLYLYLYKDPIWKYPGISPDTEIDLGVNSTGSDKYRQSGFGLPLRLPWFIKRIFLMAEAGASMKTMRRLTLGKGWRLASNLTSTSIFSFILVETFYTFLLNSLIYWIVGVIILLVVKPWDDVSSALVIIGSTLPDIGGPAREILQSLTGICDSSKPYLLVSSSLWSFLVGLSIWHDVPNWFPNIADQFPVAWYHFHVWLGVPIGFTCKYGVLPIYQMAVIISQSLLDRSINPDALGQHIWISSLWAFTKLLAGYISTPVTGFISFIKLIGSYLLAVPLTCLSEIGWILQGLHPYDLIVEKTGSPLLEGDLVDSADVNLADESSDSSKSSSYSTYFKEVATDPWSDDVIKVRVDDQPISDDEIPGDRVVHRPIHSWDLFPMIVWSPLMLSRVIRYSASVGSLIYVGARAYLALQGVMSL